MKIKHLLIGALAFAAAVACKQEEPLATPELKVDKEAVSLTATAGEATFNVTSNQDWTATADADWVSVEPASGSASEKAVEVKVTAEDNEAAEARTATVTVKAGELTKTVALTQAGTEEVPGPELPTPNADWTSAKVVSYDLPESASSKRQLLKNIKYTFDENYFYVKLQASVAEFEAAPAEYLGVFVYDVVDGSGDGYYGWWNDAKGNTELEGEHIGVFSGKDITLTIGETPVEVITEENGDELVWTLNILRSAHPNLALENPYFAFLTYIGWEPNGALPDKYEDMLQFTPAPKPVEPVTEGVIWENDGTAGASSWSAAVYRYSIEGGDSQNECVAEIPADVWAGMKIAPFTVNISPAPEAEWWQIRVTDGWWSTGDQTGDSDITMNTPGLVNYGDGTYAFQVDLTANTDLAEAMDTKHLLFAGDQFIINKIYFGEPEAPAQPEPADVDIDGKQWLFTWEVMGGVSSLIDLGVTMPGVAIIAVDYGVIDPAYAGIYGPYIVAEYTVTKTSGNSGVITLSADGLTLDVPYSDATETSVHLASADLLYEDVDCTLAASKIDIMLETPEPEPVAGLEGKQWYFSNMGVLVDLGLYEEGVMIIAVPLNDGSGFGAYMYGPYEIEQTDATSGKIIFTQYDPEWDEFLDPVEYPYSELSENVVYISAESLVGDPTPLPFVALEEPFEIQFDQMGGGNPSGPIEDGQYWFFNDTKVMAPLAEGETAGLLPAGNVIDGASTEKNIFTFMYDPDMSYYTIMDSYGRFLGQTDETGNFTVTDVLPTDDTYAYYLWCVEPGYGEAVSIYNAAYYFDITYSATDNKWVLVDGGYETPSILPVLVKAENPVEEPVEPEGPKVVTVAEFNNATDNTIEYQVSGTISGIYQAYNASYDNISLYISDETGEMLAYRVSCAGITDPAKTLTKGDLITVRGMRTLYNENPQMAQGGVIVEHTDVVVETPAGSAELSFADKANRTSWDSNQQVWEQNGIKLINDKGASTSNVADYAAPARFYKSSKITVEYAGMTKIEFVCNNGSYASALKSSITTGTVAVNGSVVTVVLPAAADSYVISSLTGGQVRMDSLTVYAE